MHLGIPELLDFFERHKEEESLVLATIIGIEGSTYRKPGAMMLASRSGCFAGMISGGCLEGDLLHHAEKVFNDGEPRFLTYDMHADDDLVWSLGLGCDGIIELQLQRLDRQDGFGFFEALRNSFRAGRGCLLALQLESPASSALVDSSGFRAGNEALCQALDGEISATPGDWPRWRFQRDEELQRLLVCIPAQTRVLVCGAGPDAVPVVRMLSELDWHVSVADHRAAFARADRFPTGCHVVQTRPEDLAQALDLNSLDAVVVMSHHLENDAAYLRQLANAGIPFIATLGPRARRDRLCDMAGIDAESVHGPAGLDIGAELPQAIALSIVAEIHAELNDRDGKSLSLRD